MACLDKPDQTSYIPDIGDVIASGRIPTTSIGGAASGIQSGMERRTCNVWSTLLIHFSVYSDI